MNIDIDPAIQTDRTRSHAAFVSARRRYRPQPARITASLEGLQ